MKKFAAGAFIRTFFILTLILLFSGLKLVRSERSALPATVLQADAVPVDEFDGVEILFIVDQSGSMGGEYYGGTSPYGPRGNDPEEYRFEGPQYALKWLSDYRQLLGEIAPRVFVAQIDFGSYVRQIMDWTEVAPATSSEAEWQSTLEDMQDAVSAERFGRTQLEFTDFRTAFSNARDMFDHAPLPAPGSNYRHAIVLLTDGAPCVPPSVPYPNYPCTNLAAVGAAEHLQNLADEVAAYFPADSYDLYMMGLDQSNAYFPELADEWTQVICLDPLRCSPQTQVVQIRSFDEMGVQFNRALSHIFRGVGGASSVDVACPPCTFTVPPYTQFLRVNVFKSNSDPIEGISLLKPSREPALPAVSGQGTPIQIYEIADNPEPGIWTVSIPGGANITGVSLISDLISARGNVPGYSGTDTIMDAQMYTDLPFTVQVVNARGIPLELYADEAGSVLYPLDVSLQLYDALQPNPEDRPPVGDPIPLRLDTEGAPGINQFVGSRLTLTAGSYEARMAATYVDDSGTTQSLIDDQSVISHLEVKESVIQWDGVIPSNELVGRSIKVAATLRDRLTSTPLDDGGRYALRVSVLAEDGTELLPQQVLPDLSVNPGEITAEFTLVQAGNHTVTAELGLVQPDGTFLPLGTPQPFLLQLRPIQYLSFSIVEPSTETTPAHQFDLAPVFNIQLDLPILTQIELRDVNDNLVSLNAATNGVETLPTLTVTSGGSPVDVNTALTESQPGVYVVTLDGFGTFALGTYDLVVSATTPDDQLAGDYRWAAPRDAHSVRRTPALGLIIAIIAVPVLVALLIVAYLVWRKWIGGKTNAPLIGSLDFHEIDYGSNTQNSIGASQLNGKRNDETIRGLPHPFKLVRVSTRGETRISEEKRLYVEEINLADGYQMTKSVPFMLSPDAGTIVIGQNAAGDIVYALSKDQGDPNSMFGGAGNTINYSN